MQMFELPSDPAARIAKLRDVVIPLCERAVAFYVARALSGMPVVEYLDFWKYALDTHQKMLSKIEEQYERSDA